MKRLALIIVIGVIATQWIRHESHREHHRRRDQLPESIVTVATDDARVIHVHVGGNDDHPRPPMPPPSTKHQKPVRKVKKSLISERKVEEAVYRQVDGRLSATEERAKDDARRQLKIDVAEWLDRDVPSRWSRLDYESERLIHETHVVPVERDYATVYKATLTANFSSENRDRIIEHYQHEVVIKRLTKLGGGLSFALVCLATVAGYIKADEATRGYYTNRLRLASTAGLGAASVALYHLLA